MNDIKAGDLVMVVRCTPCCDDPIGLGKVFTVAEVSDTIARCGICGAVIVAR